MKPHMRLPTVLSLVLVSATLGVRDAGSEGEPGRDWRCWPFSRTSPWNTPMGTAARFRPVPQLAGTSIGMNFEHRWTSAVVVATDADPMARILFGPASGADSMWNFLASGGKTCRNSQAIEIALKGTAVPQLPYPANYYSTVATPDTSLWTLPPNFEPASARYTSSLHLPATACPSPDTDALLSVFQPNGTVLDAVNAVVTSDGAIVASMASFVDGRGEGTGQANGRRASMIPSFAGLIRNGEIAGGRIPHALAALAPASLLTTAAVWPALAFDRDAGYSGTLPMGTLLAIPPGVDIQQLPLSPQGRVIARAAQDYGIYLVDRGGGGLTLLAELGNTELRWDETATTPPWWRDLELIRNTLEEVTNNSPATPGGGGTPRVAPAPDFATLVSATPACAPRMAPPRAPTGVRVVAGA